MTTLVTGGTGFVGIHVMREVAEQGETVVSVSTRGFIDDVARQFLGAACERIVCLSADILDLGKLREGIRRLGVKTVVHGAAITAIGELEREIPHQAVMVNVGGTATILEASRCEGIGRFIYLSSATVYGGGDPRVALQEEAVLNPTGIYAVTKRAGEEVVSRYLDLFGMEGAILRISAPYGPLERPSGRRTVMSPMFDWCRAAAAGEEIVLAEDLERDFTYAVDTARVVRLACQAPVLPHRVYNVSSGRNVRFSEVLETLSRLRPQLRVRRKEIDSSSSFFRQSLRGPLAIARAKGDLGFFPEYDLERGLKSYLDWLERWPI
ncbi:MAG: NAD-dependent epimerase/dehydratase family protein [Candidatus Binatia bacterium]